MHILVLPSWYITKHNLISGIFFKEQAEALVKYNNKVGIIAIQEISINETIKLQQNNFTYKKFIENDILTYILYYPAIPKFHKIGKKVKKSLFAKLFKQYIQEKGIPDIIHLHSYINGEMAIWIKENYNIPYVVTEHLSGFARGTVTPHNMDKAKKVFKLSECNIAVSNQLTQLLEDKMNNEFVYIPNFVNIDFFKMKVDIENNSFKFINIAFLNKNKNQAMLIKAFYKAFKNKPIISLTIAGDGPEYNNLKQLIEELNLEEQVFLYGRASREEVKNLLHDSNAFVLSSQYETFGVVIIEALACGLPVIATKCGGPESIITNGVGLLSDINEDSLSENLMWMVEKRSTYDSSYIRNYAKNNFSEEAVISKLNDVYKKVLK